jgi:glycosyltransferase involved in cell wall biosynthesis
MKRRVLIVVENMPVPFDTRVWKEALSLSENGYAVTVLCPKDKNHRKGYEYLKGVHIYRHPAMVGGNGALSYVLEFSCALAWEMLYSTWIYLRRGFDVIQGCNPPDDIFLVALPFRLLGVKYIFDHHDANPELYFAKYRKMGFLYKAQMLLERLCFRASDVVMTTNLSYRRLAIDRGSVAPENVFVVRNGPDLEWFNAVPVNPRWKRGKPFLVGYVGNMSVQEGLEILLEVAKHIRCMGRNDVGFICVGGGTDLARLQKIVRDENLEDVVEFTGRVSDTQLLEVLSTADICVNPDEPCEMNNISTMIKIMEYMALEKPIVQFDLMEGRYSAGDASLYVTTDNMVSDFASKILWLLDRPEERTRMGKLGRSRVEEQLAWKFSVNNLLAAYEYVFSMKNRQSQKAAEIA